MDSEDYIPINELCARYEIEVSFIRELGDCGLLHIVHETGVDCLSREDLAHLERLIRMHYDLDINLAGLEAIHHLLERMDEMRQELHRLRGRRGGDDIL